jgi:hypothetical protein
LAGRAQAGQEPPAATARSLGNEARWLRRPAGPNERAPAEIYAEANLTDSFGAAMPHARILCLRRHFFCMPTETLPSLVMDVFDDMIDDQ